jgi:prephenate dehydrogenase
MKYIFNEIVIIGAGMMGSSLIQAIKIKNLAKNITVIVDKDQHIKSLTENGLQATKNYNVTKSADLVIICSNLNSYKTILANLNKHAGAKTIVADIGSVKVMPEQLFAENYKHPLNFVPSHPIAGSDKSGFGVVINDLFKGKNVIITLKTQAAKIVEKLYKAIGMKVKYLSSEQHDHIFAEISHLPQFLAFECKHVASDFEQDVIALNNMHLQKFLRLGNSNKDLWEEIFSYNMATIVDLVCLYKEKYRVNQSSPEIFFSNLENFKELLKDYDQHLSEPSVRMELLPFKQIIVSYLCSIDIKNAKYAGSGFKDFIQPIFAE